MRLTEAQIEQITKQQAYDNGYKDGAQEGLRLADEIGLNHDIGNFMTGEHHADCRACKLLKEYGVSV